MGCLQGRLLLAPAKTAELSPYPLGTLYSPGPGLPFIQWKRESSDQHLDKVPTAPGLRPLWFSASSLGWTAASAFLPKKLMALQTGTSHTPTILVA